MDSKWAWAHEQCFLLLRIKSFVEKPVRAPARPISGFVLGRSSGSRGSYEQKSAIRVELGPGEARGGSVRYPYPRALCKAPYTMYFQIILFRAACKAL